jgi:hypothetical protein
VAKDCSQKTLTCGTGKECQAGDCVSTAPVVDSAAAPAADACEGVVCQDYCDADYTSHEQGTCNGETAQCEYATVQTNSQNCLPTAATGNVVDVPARDATTPAWFDTYGYYVGGAVIVALLGIYIWLDRKEKRRRR